MKFSSTWRYWLAGGSMLAALGLAGPAQAHGVAWSVGVGAPGAQVIVGNAPVYMAPPVVVQAPRYYRPVPVYQAAPVYYMPPPPVYYRPQPIYYGPPGHFHGHRGHGGHGWRR